MLILTFNQRNMPVLVPVIKPLMKCQTLNDSQKGEGLKKHFLTLMPAQNVQNLTPMWNTLEDSLKEWEFILMTCSTI